MQAHVLTRGRRRQDDYAYFPGTPEDRWWEEYGEIADFDFPVLLLESGGGRWRAYIGGVPTSRDDVTGTPIRLSLALTDLCGERPEVALAAALIEERIRSQAGEAVKQEATECLERAFDEEAVAGLFSGERAVDRLVDAAVREFAGTVARPPRPARPVSANSWVAALAGSEARAAFLAHVRDLLAGTVAGRALVLNCLDGIEAVPRPRPGEHLVVLADSPTERFGPDPVAIPGKVHGSTASARADGRLAWTLAGAVVGATALAWQLRRRRRRHGRR